MKKIVHHAAGLLLASAAPATVLADPVPGRATLAQLCGDCRPVRYADCESFLEGPNFDRDGRLWAVDFKGGNIVEIANGKCRNVVNTGGSPNGARFHSDGRLFVADAKRGLLIFDPRTRKLTVRAASVAGRPLVGSNDIVFDRAGGLYMTVRMTSSLREPDGLVLYLPPGETTQPRIVADRLPFPNGIALSADGAKLFVGLYADKTIVVLPPVDRPAPYLTSWVHARTEGGVGPDGMMADTDGRLWHANFGDGTISVLGPTARLLGRIELPADAGLGTTNVTVHGDALYITEAFKGDVWRVPLTAKVAMVR